MWPVLPGSKLQYELALAEAEGRVPSFWQLLLVSPIEASHERQGLIAHPQQKRVRQAVKHRARRIALVLRERHELGAQTPSDEALHPGRWSPVRNGGAGSTERPVEGGLCREAR